MRKPIATVAALTVLAVPALAEAQTVTGKLSEKEARRAVTLTLPGQAPKLLLKDERADFYKTTKISVNPLHRINKSEINVHYKLTMRADKEHRKKHWYPIDCHGVVWIGKLDTGKLVGDIKHYTCITDLTKGT